VLADKDKQIEELKALLNKQEVTIDALTNENIGLKSQLKLSEAT